jgi:broad specificity phosphatase PhoE
VYTKETLELIKKDPWNFAPPKGESQKQVEERFAKFVQEKILDPWDRKKDLHVAIFGHGVAIKCLLRFVLDSNPQHTWKIAIENTSVTEIAFTEELGWSLMRVNDCAHLQLDSPNTVDPKSEL